MFADETAHIHIQIERLRETPGEWIYMIERYEIHTYTYNKLRVKLNENQRG